MAKPFIAARIPQTVADKLDERVKDSGQGKTDIIINALAQYLGCSIEVPEETQAVDRLIAVEKELTKLQNRVRALEKPIEKDPDLEIPGQRVLSFEASNIDNIVDNKTENTETRAETIKEATDISSDNNLLTHNQMAELTGMKFETVKSRHRKLIPIEWEGKQYNPIRDGKRQKWQIVNSVLSNIDN
jgi:hypothetical protein